MSETWFSVKLKGQKDPEVLFGYPYRYHDMIEKVEEVEVRPLRQEPCDWEDEPVWSDEPDPEGMFPGARAMLRSEHCIDIGCKFCPMCGRKLETGDAQA